VLDCICVCWPNKGCCQDLGGFIELGFVRFECLGGFFFGSFFSVVTLFSVSCSFVLLTERERERERERAGWSPEDYFLLSF
jgi:hypothetical protein